MDFIPDILLKTIVFMLGMVIGYCVLFLILGSYMQKRQIKRALEIYRYYEQIENEHKSKIKKVLA